MAAILIAAATPLFAQTPDGTAKLLQFTGQISVERNDHYAWALNTGDSIKPLEVVVTGPDGWGIFQVSDGSKFEVYPNSKVVFRANRFDWTTLLELWLGKVRVQIEHLGGQPNPNSVRTPTAVISVRGTIFDVEVEPQTNTTLVLDEEGVVVVRHLLRPSEKVLQPGEYVRVYQNEPLAKALMDNGGIMQRLAHAAQDAFYQAAINGHGSIVGKAGTTTCTAACDKQGGGNAPPAPTAPAAPPPPPPPPH